ncbi:MAG: hypothetical protein WKF43_16695 [Acidimicrobiales bacterium]
MPPRLAKLLALIVAAALIGGAFWYRSRNDDGGDAGPGDGPSRSGDLTIACVSELSEVCEGLEDVKVTIEDAGTTATALAAFDGGPPPFDAWVTLDPWPEMVDVVRRVDQRSDLFDEPTAVGSMATAILSFASVVEDLSSECAEVSWSCLGENAGPQSKVAIPPADSATGVLLAGQAASSRLETTSFDREAILDPPSQTGLKRLLGSSSSRDATAPVRMVQQGPAAFIAAGTGEPVARAATLTQQGRQREMVVLDPEPAASFRVVVAPLVSGERADRAIALLTGNTGVAALRNVDWTVPAADGGTGLPEAGVLVALRQEID